MLTMNTHSAVGCARQLTMHYVRVQYTLLTEQPFLQTVSIVNGDRANNSHNPEKKERTSNSERANVSESEK